MLAPRRLWLRTRHVLVALGLVTFSAAASAQALRGVNLDGPEFTANILPGVYGQDFIYPNDGEISYFTQHGMNVFRLPLLWERLQPALNGKLDPAELGRLKTFIGDAEAHGAAVLIDVHNYGYFRGTLIGQNGVTGADFANLWIHLAQQFGRDNHVMFGLMNEPKQSSPNMWRKIVQQAILAIRATGAQNRILVSGIDWDSADKFPAVSGASLGQLQDPDHRLVFEVHQYFDPNGSGVSDQCIAADLAVARLSPFTSWLRANHHKGFLGEFGVGRGPECLAVLSRVAAYLQANADVWLGWTYWAAGPLWGEYMYTLEPKSGADRPQMRILRPYLGNSGKLPD